MIVHEKTSTGYRRCQCLVGVGGPQCSRRSRISVPFEGQKVFLCSQHADMKTAGLQPMKFVDVAGEVHVLQEGVNRGDKKSPSDE